MMRLAIAAMAVALAAACALPVLAQDYPSKPVKFVVGFPPGGSTDVISRVLGQKLSERLGQPFIVEQKVGGVGLIANDFVAKSPPDGTSMVLLTGGHPGTAAIMKKLPYDPVKDFGMVSTVIAYPMVISVAQDSPIKSLPDLFARAKAQPGRISFSSAGMGSLHHLLGEWMNIEAGTNMLHVPFKGAAPAMVEVLGGRIDVIIETATFAFGQIRGGKLRGLALSSAGRYPLMPELPTVAETVPGVEFSSWLGVAVSPGTPRPVVDKLNRELRAILELADVKQRFAEFGGVATASSPEEMQARIEREIARWRRVVELKNIERQ
ncbi:MAG: tripartite tricarboxylate transporter substrate binding protein [Betaproteobacteria bacterium]|nr:tripartite tricarboxylate transporter substrate binding protein [Betaproteobacteria bacterium]